MKTYIKPSINVVDLAVKENIAALPLAMQGNAVADQQVTGATGGVTLTTYNLAAQTLGSSADA